MVEDWSPRTIAPGFCLAMLLTLLTQILLWAAVGLLIWYVLLKFIAWHYTPDSGATEAAETGSDGKIRGLSTAKVPRTVSPGLNR
jgi:hypothetical protein